MTYEVSDAVVQWATGGGAFLAVSTIGTMIYRARSYSLRQRRERESDNRKVNQMFIDEASTRQLNITTFETNLLERCRQLEMQNAACEARCQSEVSEMRREHRELMEKYITLISRQSHLEGKVEGMPTIPIQMSSPPVQVEVTHTRPSDGVP